MYNCIFKVYIDNKQVTPYFIGVYISKTTYIRQGEQSLDGFYRAWHQVDYYRYSHFKMTELLISLAFLPMQFMYNAANQDIQ